jgi:hypothetical protein
LGAKRIILRTPAAHHRLFMSVHGFLFLLGSYTHAVNVSHIYLRRAGYV